MCWTCCSSTTRRCQSQAVSLRPAQITLWMRWTKWQANTDAQLMRPRCLLAAKSNAKLLGISWLFWPLPSFVVESIYFHGFCSILYRFIQYLWNAWHVQGCCKTSKKFVDNSPRQGDHLLNGAVKLTQWKAIDQLELGCISHYHTLPYITTTITCYTVRRTVCFHFFLNNVFIWFICLI